MKKILIRIFIGTGEIPNYKTKTFWALMVFGFMVPLVLWEIIYFHSKGHIIEFSWSDIGLTGLIEIFQPIWIYFAGFLAIAGFYITWLRMKQTERLLEETSKQRKMAEKQSELTDLQRKMAQSQWEYTVERSKQDRIDHYLSSMNEKINQLINGQRRGQEVLADIYHSLRQEYLKPSPSAENRVRIQQLGIVFDRIYKRGPTNQLKPYLGILTQFLKYLSKHIDEITRETISDIKAKFSELELIIIFAYMNSATGQTTIYQFLEKIEFFKNVEVSDREFNVLFNYYNNPS